MAAPGDDDFAEFAAARWSAFVRFAAMLTGDFHEAEDLVQATLVKVYARWSALRDRGDADAYVRRALVNGNISRHRKHRVTHVLMPLIPDTRTRDEDPVGQRDELDRALARLTARQRAIVVLRYCEDFSEERTAQVLGCSVGAIKSQSSRALARLRGLLPLPDHVSARGGRP